VVALLLYFRNLQELEVRSNTAHRAACIGRTCWCRTACCTDGGLSGVRCSRGDTNRARCLGPDRTWPLRRRALPCS
jgi:hypothetical protein